MTIDQKIFNTEKTDYNETPLFLGADPGLFDTVNKKFPKIWSKYKLMKSLDWDENEFNYSSCLKEFESCSPSVYDMMIKTLAWQWEADTVASKATAPILAPVISNSELWAALQRISDNEVLHAATYSEIVRNSFKRPEDVIDEVLKVEEAMARMTTVTTIFSTMHDKGHKYALGLIENDQELYNSIYLYFVALLALERIQFMSSFAITFAICDTGLFTPIGKAVQKIAQDEFEVHSEFDKEVIRAMLKEERGQIAAEQCKPIVSEILHEVLRTEYEWTDYLFSEGRELVGVNADLIKRWSTFCAKDVFNFLKIKSDEFTFPTNNPLRYMEDWLDIAQTQASPQEEDNGQYKVGLVRRDDEDVIFDDDF